MSPDLSRLENVWSIMVWEMEEEEVRQPAQQLSADQLWNDVQTKWDEGRRHPASSTPSGVRGDAAARLR